MRAFSLDAVPVAEEPAVEPKRRCVGCKKQLADDGPDDPVICQSCYAKLTQQIAPSIQRQNLMTASVYVPSTNAPYRVPFSYAEVPQLLDSELVLSAAQQKQVADAMAASVAAAMLSTAMLPPPTVQPEVRLATLGCGCQHCKDGSEPRETCLGDLTDHARAALLACPVFRPKDSYQYTCKCGNRRVDHSRTQIDAWMATLNMLFRK